jgi:hypothetical protein
MDRTAYESVRTQHGGEVVEFANRQIDGAPALLADDVMVLTEVDQVDDAGPVTEMNVTEVAGVLEHVDGAIDGGWIYPRADQGLDLLMKIRRRQVIVMRLGQHLADGAAGDSDAKAG